MGMFGQNVITSEGDDWQRHRKIVAPLLNERISKTVWEESSRQANDMLKSFTAARSANGQIDSSKRRSGDTDATIPGVRSIAINVLGSVAYGTEQPWRQESTEAAPPGYRLSYMDAILAVAENLAPATFIPVKMLTSPVMPKSVQRIGFAVAEFPQHVKQLLKTERTSNRPSQGNLLSTLVTVSDAESRNTTSTSKSKLFLSESELAGNLFQFTIAGFDTTANTMAYAITLLAIHPEWQDWISEEIDAVVRNSPDMPYEEAYPALKRCLALMVSDALRISTTNFDPKT